MNRSLPVDADARQRIAGVLDDTLFVEAGAGTGKTACFVERVVALVTEGGIDLANIAAITFTEAAAAELRDRIHEALERRQAETVASGDDHGAARCAAAIDDIDVAAISTLHSFAHRILTEHPVEIGIPPRVEVLDEVQSQLEFERRWHEFVDEIFEDPELEPLLVRALLLGVRIDAADKLPSLRQLARVFNDNWDRLEAAARLPITVARLDRSLLYEPLAAVDRLAGACTDPEDLLATHIDAIGPEIEEILAADDDLVALRLLATKSKWRTRVGRKENWGGDAGPARDILAAADTACVAVVGAATDAVLSGLVGRVARFTLGAARARRAEGRLEFHDLLVLARSLLRSSDEARRALHGRYQRLLFDEFQDTDPIQIELAVLIAAASELGRGQITRPWAEVAADAKHLFFVGDPKQSIYRFRRADIGLFLAARDRFGGREPVRLSQNYRTVPTVVNWINHLFGELMEEEVEGRQPAYEPLEADRAEGDADHRVVLLGGPHDRNEDLRAGPLREMEAAEVATAIGEIRRRPEDWPVFDRSTGRWRAPRLDEITILLPTRTSLPLLESALAARDIPYRADTGTLVYNTQEIRDLLATLRAISDSGDVISLVAALRSPIFACGDDDLAAWHAAGGNWSYLAPRRDLDDHHPVARALAFLAARHAERHWTDPSRLIERIIADQRLFESAFAHRRPRDVWRRLRFFVDQARLYTESNGSSLVGFIDWTDLQRADGARVHEPLLDESDDESVRIMTVHGAKGLEFPITILSGLTTERAARRTGVRVHWGADGLPQVALRRDVATEAFERTADLEIEMDAHEKLRLLYVGLTRARDHLLVATHHNQGRGSFAEQIWTHSEAVADRLCRMVDRVGTTSPSPSELDLDLDLEMTAAESFAGSTAQARAMWISERAALLDSQGGSRSISATAIARAAWSPELVDPAFAVEADDIWHGELEGGDGWRQGRAGTAIGRAVHAVLQSVDLATGTGNDALATVHAELEAVPDAVAEIASRAATARTSSLVQRAVSTGRYWRETYVAAPLGARLVEGYVDLLFETDEGLVVVDYKTDVVTPTEIDAKVDRYRLQGAAYALAVAVTTGRPVAECWFVFAGIDGAVERRVEDLAAAVDEVKRIVEVSV